MALSTTIEGESLMNDGSAVVLFFVLKEIATYGGLGVPGYTDAPTIIWTFCRMALLGPLIGITFGYISLLWISRVFNDPLVEISISIFTAYLAFYVSEFWVHSSGVLTVVFVGLAFSSRGRTSISPEVFHFLHEFWETLGYVANTIIFLITGIAISYNSFRIEFTASDIAISFMVYGAGVLIRMIIFTVTYPLFKRTPYGWTWQEALIASWGGLRGAVGLALGLDIMFTSASASSVPCPAAPASPNLACDEVKGRILLHTSAMVVLTLLINASTLKPLLALLRFVELSHEELTMLAHVAERLKKDSRKELKRIQDDPFLSNSNWEVVRTYSDLNELFRPLLKGMTVGKVKHGKERRGSHDGEHPTEELTGRHSRIDVPDILSRQSIDLSRHSMRSSAADEQSPETNLLSELKYHYHMSLKAGIWHLQHQGTLGSSATDILVDALNHKLDDKHAVDWIKWSELQALGGQTTGFRLQPWMQNMRKLPLVGNLVTQYVGQRLTMWHDIAFGFLTVHEHLEHEVEHWTHDPKLLSSLHEVLHENAEGARKSLIDLQEVLPEVVLTVNTRQAARLMLNATREKVHALETQGLLPEPQAKAMVSQVEIQMRKLQLAHMPLDFSKEKVLREVSWMQELTAESFAVLVEAAQEHTYTTGEYLVRQGDMPLGDLGSVFLVARGIVEIVEEYANGDSSVVARRGSGVVIGEQSLLTGAPRAASARAATSVVVLGLSHKAMSSAMELYPELADRMWHHVGLNLAQKLLGDAEEATTGERTSTAEELHASAEAWVPSMSAVLAFDAGERMVLERRVLLLHGSCIEYRELETPPSARQLEELQLSVQREAEEAQRTEQQAMRQVVKREKTRGRRLSLKAAIFGAGDVAEGAEQRATGSQQNGMTAGARLCSGATSAQASDGGGGAVASSKLKPVEFGKERRSLHQTSPWIVHIAPCLIEVPAGGSQAKHELQCLSSCRLACQPKPAAVEPAPSPAHHVHGHVEIDGAPLPSLTSPHELRPALVASMLKKLTAVRFQPGEVILDAASHSKGVVYFPLSGQVRCDLDPSTSSAATPDDPHGTAGEPFAKRNAEPVVFSPSAGAPLGEWLLLQPQLAQLPRVVAHTPVSCVCLTEDVLVAALQQDDQLATNFWWARCQRETFCMLRKLEPFCWWQPSKVWKWIQLGRHIKVPEGRGQLGVNAPFIVLVQGKCHISYNEDVHFPRESGGARYSVDGQRRRLGSYKLLGSGAKISDLLTFSGAKSRNTFSPQSPLTTPKGTLRDGGGKWVPGPDVIHCHEEIAYHFSRDSLVFVPTERCLPWLPSNYAFSQPINGADAGSPGSPFGMRIAGSPDKRGSGGSPSPPENPDNLAA